MSRFVLHHRHEPHECGVVFAAFEGHVSPLRSRTALASCRSGGHAIWWTVDARDARAALHDLPFFVGRRSSATQVAEVVVP